jgi:hypothetical protein
VIFFFLLFAHLNSLLFTSQKFFNAESYMEGVKFAKKISIMANDKTISHFQMSILCQFKSCHNRRNYSQVQCQVCEWAFWILLALNRFSCKLLSCLWVNNCPSLPAKPLWVLASSHTYLEEFRGTEFTAQLT